jgi:hypothetical protein
MKYHPDFINDYVYNDTSKIDIKINDVIFIFTVFENSSEHRFNVKKCTKVLKEFLDIIETYPKMFRNKINIEVYDIPKKKNLPPKNETIEPKHINSGYCYTTSGVNDINIVIFRREEFFKVLIHELLHFFDIIPYNHDLETLYGNMFNSVHSINVNEALVELYAIHISCEIISKIKGKKLDELLESEYEFSITQCKKLMKQQDVTFSDILKNKFVWHQDTNAFSYFILKQIFFNFTLGKSINDLHDKLNNITNISLHSNIKLSKLSV